jgi:hypothetical protein
MLKRWLKLLGKILLALVVLVIVFLLFERFRGQIVLASYKRKLIAQSEKLSALDFTSTVIDSDNGAPAAVAAIERLERGTVLPNSPPPRMRLLGSGRAIVGFREREWVDASVYRDGEWVNETVTNHWEQLATDLKANKTILAEIRTALDKPVLNNHLDYAQGPKLKIPHLAKAKSLTYWLGSEIQLALREARNQDAITNIRCQVRLPMLLAKDRVLISELMRVALAGIARTDTWEALQQADWKDEELATLQDAWQSQRFADAMTRSLERELMSVQITYEQLRASNDETYRLFEMFTSFAAAFNGDESEEDGKSGIWEKIPFHEDLTEFWRRQIYCRVWRFAWSCQAELRDLKIVYAALGFMRKAAVTESYGSIKDQLEVFTKAAEEYGFYDQLRFSVFQVAGAYAKSVVKAMKAETDRSLAICAIALKRHSIRYGKLPESLDALTPEFLSAVPLDYMDGKSMSYHLNGDGGFTLYSVGEDGKDDGGDLSLPEGSKSKDLWRRRDYVWPAPALPEEVEVYRRESAEK